VAAALLIGCGVYITVRTVQNGLIVAIYGLPISTLALGLVVLTAAFIGCFGACNLNGCLIKWSVELIQQYFNSSIHKIESGIGGSQLLNSIRKIQTRLDCCGAYGPGDWKDPYEFCCRTGRLCFRTPQLGCVQAADKVLTEGRLPLGITIIVLGVIELGAVACAAFLTRRIRRIGSSTAPLT
ncbi:Leukocyte surface antigen CD53, partial [Taenia solium]